MITMQFVTTSGMMNSVTIPNHFALVH